MCDDDAEVVVMVTLGPQTVQETPRLLEKELKCFAPYAKIVDEVETSTILRSVGVHLSLGFKLATQ